MIKANEYFKDTLQQLVDTPYNTKGEKVRPHYVDGTPSHTKFITDVCRTYDISKGEFPVSTFRPVAIKGAIGEILWIYKEASNDISLLKNKYNVHWWDDWNIGDGTIGQRYGATIKKYDLMNKLLNGLKEQPYGRRHIINMYQYSDFEETKGLNPCAFQTTWNVRGEYLDMTLFQRSSDFVVSNCINEIQYCALLMMVARHVGLKPGKFTHFSSNVHMYDRHEEQVKELLTRTPSNKQPRLILNPDKTNFYDFEVSDFQLVDFEPAGKQLKFELAI